MASHRFDTTMPTPWTCPPSGVRASVTLLPKTTELPALHPFLRTNSSEMVKLFVQGHEERRRAVAIVVVCHRSAPALFSGRPGFARPSA